MRGIRPPALFELRAQSRPPAKARNAVDLHHLPEGTHSLAPRPGSLVRLTFQIGPRGRTCTCNLSVLSGTPLPWATRGPCGRPPVPTAGFAPTLRAFEVRRLCVGLRGRNGAA